jgi:hypothetical protein
MGRLLLDLWIPSHRIGTAERKDSLQCVLAVKDYRLAHLCNTSYLFVKSMEHRKAASLESHIQTDVDTLHVV